MVVKKVQLGALKHEQISHDTAYCFAMIQIERILNYELTSATEWLGPAGELWAVCFA